MGYNTFNTSDAYTKLVVNTSSELIGNYPDIIFRIHYSMKIKLTNWGSWYYNGFYLWFHDKPHYVNLNISCGPAGDETPWLASGYVDLKISGQKTSHSPGCGCSGPFSCSASITEEQTIPNGSMTSNIVSVGHNSAVFNVALDNPRNYFYPCIYNQTDKKWEINYGTAGNNTVTGLTPGKQYMLSIEMWARDGKEAISRKNYSFMTSGFSYLDANVTNTIGNSISFDVKTYSDAFTTRVTVTCGNITLCTQDVKSSNSVYKFSYTPSTAQLNSIYSQIPKALSIGGTITLTTYVNGTAIGSRNYTITYKINENTNIPYITSFDYADTVQKAIDKTGNAKWVLQGVSKLQIKNIVAGARNGASISTYRVTIGETVVNATSFPINVDSLIESNSGIYLTVIDSRGLQVTKKIDFTKFISYTYPAFTEAKLTRVNDVEETTTLTVKGTFDRLPINNVDKNVSLNFYYRYRQSDSSTWSGLTNKQVTINNNQFSYSNVIGSFDVGISYVFECYIEDYFVQRGRGGVLLNKGQYELFIGDGYLESNGLWLAPAVYKKKDGTSEGIQIFIEEV